MDISKMSETELKALAYDETVKITVSQRNLQLIEQQLQKIKEEHGTDKSNE